MTSLINHIPVKNVTTAMTQEDREQWRNELDSKGAKEG